MKMISWNVNGLRACVKKGFAESIRALDPDVLCLQETKLQQGQENIPLDGYEVVFNSADKKGYSGTAIYSRVPVLGYTYGLGMDEHDREGRVITAEFEEYYLVCCYTPNSQRGLLRLDYRMVWEDAMRAYLLALDAKKPVILAGDLNVAHQEMDLKNPKTNRMNAGFTDQERAKFTQLLEAGFVDSFRHLHPDTIAYSWWSYMGNARANNSGWRIDYFTVSERLAGSIARAAIHPDIMGSDHCPVELVLNPNPATPG
ncbi:MAG: exodeoxyribonuclease III [Christensenellales bacterium]|jgi:exodeoxyribonuclease-3